MQARPPPIKVILVPLISTYATKWIILTNWNRHLEYARMKPNPAMAGAIAQVSIHENLFPRWPGRCYNSWYWRIRRCLWGWRFHAFLSHLIPWLESQGVKSHPDQRCNEYHWMKPKKRDQKPYVRERELRGAYLRVWSWRSMHEPKVFFVISTHNRRVSLQIASRNRRSINSS